MKHREESVGAYLSAAPLLAMFPEDMPNTVIAERLGVARMTVSAWRQGRRIQWRHADKHAIKLGLHPLSVWGDEWFLGAVKGPKRRKGKQ